MTAALGILPETALPVWLQSDVAGFEFETGLVAFGDRIEALPSTADATQIGIRQNFRALLAGYRQGDVTSEGLRAWLVQIARTSPQTLPFFRQPRQKRFASGEQAIAEAAAILGPHKEGVALRLLTPLPPEPLTEPKTIRITLHTYFTLVQSRAQLEELSRKYGQVYHRYLLVECNGKYVLRVCNLAADPDEMLLEGEKFVAEGHLLYSNISTPAIAFDYPAIAPSFSEGRLREIFQHLLGFQNPNQVRRLVVLPPPPHIISRP